MWRLIWLFRRQVGLHTEPGANEDIRMPRPDRWCLIFLAILVACGRSSRREQSDRDAARLESQLIAATTIDMYLRDHVGFASDRSQLRCGHVPLGADTARGVLYVWAYCRAFPRGGSGATSGSGLIRPLVLHFKRSSGVTMIVSHDAARDGRLYRPDIERLFPTEVRSHPVFTGPPSAARMYFDSLQRAMSAAESRAH